MVTVTNHDIAEVIGALLADATAPVYLVGPSVDTIEALVEVATESDEPPVVYLLSEEEVLKSVFQDFLVASHAADLISAGTISIRTGPITQGNELIVAADSVAGIVTAGSSIAALSTENPEFVERANEYYSELWEEAATWDLRTPPLSRIRSSLADEVGEDVETDFTAVLESLETARGNGNGLDEVTISLLVAAKNQELLYDISKWGEDIGIASKATFSRTKTTLEELGLIDTEKVPIDVGRPRLRLKFAHEKLREATAQELASVAQSLMA